MKKFFLTALTLSFLASVPAWAADHCNCDKSCKKACADGKTASCDCASPDCKDCGCKTKK